MPAEAEVQAQKAEFRKYDRRYRGSNKSLNNILSEFNECLKTATNESTNQAAVLLKQFEKGQDKHCDIIDQLIDLHRSDDTQIKVSEKKELTYNNEAENIRRNHVSMASRLKSAIDQLNPATILESIIPLASSTIINQSTIIN